MYITAIAVQSLNYYYKKNHILRLYEDILFACKPELLVDY